MTGSSRFRVRCPACKQALLAPLSGSNGQYQCEGCLASYPIRRGVIDLLPGLREERTIAQWMMEWTPLVRSYESRLWRRNPLLAVLMRISFEREYAVIKAAAQLHGDCQVLDLACGSGIYARRLAREVPAGVVIGVDLSLPMLHYAAQRVQLAGIENLLLIHGDAAALPFAAGSFDVVNCCGALHLFPDVTRVLQEVSRVLKPGGRFTVAAFRRGESRLAALRARMRRQLYGIDAFTPSELAPRLKGAGLAEPHCLHAAGIWLIMSAKKLAGL